MSSNSRWLSQYESSDAFVDSKLIGITQRFNLIIDRQYADYEAKLLLFKQPSGRKEKQMEDLRRLLFDKDINEGRIAQLVVEKSSLDEV